VEKNKFHQFCPPPLVAALENILLTPKLEAFVKIQITRNQPKTFQESFENWTRLRWHNCHQSWFGRQSSCDLFIASRTSTRLICNSCRSTSASACTSYN